MKVQPDLPYMTAPERSTFKKLKDAGQITMFRMGRCEACGADMIKHKRFCSWECYVEQEGEDDGEGEGNQGQVD